jgi:hypothetical protein
MVRHSRGSARFVPFSELWEVSGRLADTFPLDRELVTLPRVVRQSGHWTRLVFVDKAVTNREGTAVLTASDTPWVAAVGAAIVAAAVVPKLPVWARGGFFAAVAVVAFRGRRLQHYLEMRRELGRVAPEGVLVGDFMSRQPDAGMTWVSDLLGTLDAAGETHPFVALLPDAGNPRRSRARVRLYTTRCGFRVAGRTHAGGRPTTILVRGARRPA